MLRDLGVVFWNAILRGLLHVVEWAPILYVAMKLAQHFHLLSAW